MIKKYYNLFLLLWLLLTITLLFMIPRFIDFTADETGGVITFGFVVVLFLYIGAIISNIIKRSEK